MINTVLEHVPIKLERFNDDYSSDSSICGASSSSKAVPATTSTTSVASSCSRTNDLDNEIESCGNVFIFQSRKLFLICGYCDCKYANMLQLAKHLNDCHNVFSTNDMHSNQGNNGVASSDIESDSEASSVAGLFVQGSFQIRFVGEGSTPTEETTIPTPRQSVDDILLKHVPIKVEEEVPNDVITSCRNLSPTFENNIESCGNIFIMNRKKLFLVCGFCEGQYANMELLASHLQESHSIFEEDDINIPTEKSTNIQIKEEPQEILLPIKRRQTTNEDTLPMVAIPNANVEDKEIDASDETSRSSAAIAEPKKKKLLAESNSQEKLSNPPTETEEFSDDIESFELVPSHLKEYIDFITDNKYSCKKCPKNFTKLCRMLEHIRIHTGEKPYKCRECGKSFRIKLRMTEHMMRHREIKAYICEFCGLGCATRQDYALHQRHHRGDKRYSCKECGKAFVRSGDLKTHLRIHSDERPYKCEKCNATFRANQNLIIHRRVHENVKKFKCDYCDKRFLRNIDKKVHHRTHTGEKAAKCEICGKGYSAKVHVRRHIEQRHMNPQQLEPNKESAKSSKKVSQRNKLFKCTKCPKSYSGMVTLRKHLEQVHATSLSNNENRTPKVILSSSEPAVIETAIG